MSYRTKALVLPTVTKCTTAEVALLKGRALTEDSYWGTKIAADKKLIAKFKAEVKEYYWYQQLRRCCYCSIELAKAQNTYDAEHIIDKGVHPQFMFETSNLAAACKPCNNAKDQAWVLTSTNTPAAVPPNSEDYSILHPHLDEWYEHFDYDDFERVVAKPGTKGPETLKVCKIHKLNAARLADHFVGNNKAAEKFFLNFHDASSIEKKQAKLDLIRNLAGQYQLPAATAIVESLEDELARFLEENPSP